MGSEKFTDLVVVDCEKFILYTKILLFILQSFFSKVSTTTTAAASLPTVDPTKPTIANVTNPETKIPGPDFLQHQMTIARAGNIIIRIFLYVYLIQVIVSTRKKIHIYSRRTYFIGVISSGREK